jgi:hypothetical protein
MRFTEKAGEPESWLQLLLTGSEDVPIVVELRGGDPVGG